MSYATKDVAGCFGTHLETPPEDSNRCFKGNVNYTRRMLLPRFQSFLLLVYEDLVSDVLPRHILNVKKGKASLSGEMRINYN